MRLSAMSVIVAGLLSSGCAVEVFSPDDVSAPAPTASVDPSQGTGTVVPIASAPSLVDPAIRPALAPGDRTRLMEAAEAGATCVIQPGGSMRDDEVIAAADKAGLAMVFTGMRHFRHCCGTAFCSGPVWPRF